MIGWFLAGVLVGIAEAALIFAAILVCSTEEFDAAMGGGLH